jgi:hypothetical protein
MKITTTHGLALAAVAVMVGFFTSNLAAQGQGNFDPAQFRQRQKDGARDRLEVKSDDDWKKIEPLIGKVIDAQREARMGMGGFGAFGGRGGRGGRGGGGGGGGGGGNAGGSADQAANNNRPRFGGSPGPEAEALQKAMDDKAPADEIKAKLAKVRDARKEKEAALVATQDELRKALSPRQEAGAVLAGFLR